MKARWGKGAAAAISIGIVALMVLPAGAGLPVGPAFAHPAPDGRAATIGAPAIPRPEGGVFHDLQVATAAFGSPAGAALSFTASLAGDAGLSGSVNWTWGDGSTTTSPGAPTSHVFGHPGLYEVQAAYTDPVTGDVHDNLADLLAVPVWATHAGDDVGTAPQLTGWVVANTTVGAGATALVAPGGSVTVAAELGQAIPAPSVSDLQGRFSIASGVAVDTTWSDETLDPSGLSQATATFSGSAPAGTYPLTFLLTANVTANNVTYPINGAFTFSVAIGAGLGGGVVPYASSAEPAALTAYQTASSPESLDPTTDWDTAGAQVFRNVYQTLIIPNGSQTGSSPSSFLPEIATCVPGSAQCTALYGSSLVSGYNYTFVIGNSSQFYDPVAAAGWPVYPSDVEFTIARTLGLSNLPCSECTNGWMLAQALLPSGSYLWDGGLHGQWNNTPLMVADSMTVNGTDCPTVAETDAHGCITFHADGSGTSWPFFEQLVADPFGASIVSCGWYSAPSQSGGIPYWSQGNVTGEGDAPCPAWGDGMGSSPGAVPATGWDNWEFDAAFSDEGIIESSAAGSGPYYLSQYSSYTGYTLQENPDYQANPDCPDAGCPPAPGTYVATVNVNFEASTAPGLAALSAGAADWADAVTNDSGTLAADAAQGIATPVLLPQLEFWANGFDFDYNVSLAAQVLGTTPTAPPELLTDPDLRQFLITAFPYATLQSSTFTQNGTEYAFPFGGGVIPLYEGGAAPANVSWPSGDPASDNSSVVDAAAWWSATQEEGLSGSNCTALSPCTFPVGYLAPNPLVGAAESAWAAEVSSLSGGAIVPEVVAMNLSVFVETLFNGPGGNPMAVTANGWINDYPDASDPVNGLYSASGEYGSTLAYPTVLQAFNHSGCPTSASHWATLPTAMPLDCQGAAYNASLALLAQAAAAPLGPPRTAEFAEAEQIGQRLGLDGAVDQINSVAAVAPWIVPSSVPANAWLDGDGVAWYMLSERTGPSVPLGVRGPVASPALVPTSGVLTLSATAVGGVGGYSYAWSGVPGGCSPVDAPSWSCEPDQAGTFSIVVTVRDGDGHSAATDVEVDVTGIEIASFSATPATVTLGGSTTIATVLASVIASASYTYTGLPRGCVSTNLSTFSCEPTETGVFPLTVVVQAPNGSKGTASTTLTVTVTGLLITEFTATPSAFDLGSATTLALHLTNATGPVSVRFSGPPGCNQTAPATESGGNWTATDTCTPSVTGAFTESANVTAANGLVNGSTSLTIHALPSGVVLAAPAAVDLGERLTFVANVTGGTAPFDWSFTGLPAGCASTDSATLTCTPTSVGPNTITVHLEDVDSQRASATASVTVNAALQIVEFVAVPDSITLGGSTNLTVRLGGGTAPYVYNFTGLPASCPSSSTGTLQCIATTAGTYTVAVSVVDATGARVNGTASLNVTSGSGGSTPPATLAGLPLDEAIALIAVLLIVVVAAVAIVMMRRPKPPPPEAGREAPPSSD